MDDWTKAAITFGSGTITGLLTSGFLPYMHQYISALRFRNRIYGEIIVMYRALFVVVDEVQQNPYNFDMVVADVKRNFAFENFTSAKKNTEVFYWIKEAHQINEIYRQLRIRLERPFSGSSEYLASAKWVIRQIEERIRDNELDAATLLRNCPANIKWRVGELAYRNVPLSFQAEYDRLAQAQGQASTPSPSQ
jgi:hypothetical protein